MSAPIISAPIAVAEAVSDEQILATRDVMRQLRPHLPFEEYLPTVKRMMQSDGYRLLALYEKDAIVAVAGFRLMEKLSSGKTLYVDDLNTDERARSRAHGKALLDWLKREAKANGCVELHLDSGVHREAAHRFYFRERLTIRAYHFHVGV
ncbi:MAG TPA: GNAT family N-acetyltransferase [Bryobacteraceae bacterium]|jgi:GNAT superfamily N-acetyltransferase